MSGFDPEAILEAVAGLYVPDDVGVDVQPFPMATPMFPVMGFFFVSYVEDTFEGTGTFTIEARTAFTYSAEESLRALYRTISRGADRPESVVDVLVADRSLGGLIHDVRPGDVRIEAAGDENAGLFVGTVVLHLLTDRLA